MTRLWWVRHGPTHARTMVGWSDLPADLSDHAALARLSACLPADAVMVSSDLGRAVHTADALQAGRHRLPHDPDLREMHFGAWELHSHAEVEAEEPALIRAFWETPGEVRPPGGESWNDLAHRVGRGVERLLRRHSGRDIIIVAHFGAILSALQQAGNLDAAETFAHRIDPLSVTTMSHSGRNWSVGVVNHLP